MGRRTRHRAGLLAGLLGLCVLPWSGCVREREPEPPGASGDDARERPGSISSLPLPRRANLDAGAPLFERLPPDATGVEYDCRMDPDHRLSRLNHSVFVAGGVAIGDVSGDGRPDIFFANGPGANRLYLQRGELRFEEVTETAGVGGGDHWGTGSTFADIDRDGDLDLFVCNYDSPNQLFLNDGSAAAFRESAAAFGLALADGSLMPAFADYDNDGDLDLFVLTYRLFRPGGRPAQPPVGFKDGAPHILPEFEKYYYLRQTGPKSFTADTSGRPDFLFRNNGDGTFTDVSVEAGVHNKGHGLSATFWDFDRDGWVDLYIGNDFVDPDRLYRNNGDGTFTDVIADVMPYTTWSSMGADCADIDNDGLLDFMSADMAATTHYKSKVTMGEMGDRRWFLENAWPRQIMRNTVYLNSGTERFLEVAYLCGIAQTDWTWAVKLADFDEDGRVDLFVSNGVTRLSTDADRPVTPEMLIGRTEWEIWKDEPALPEQNLAYRNAGDLRFTEVSQSWGLDHAGMSYGAAHGDLDGDGDLDLVVVNVDEPASIYRNRTASGHRVLIDLVGDRGNPRAIGAVVRLHTASGPQVRQMNPATGYLSTNEAVLHFGLGRDTSIERLAVRWPNGAEQSFEDLEVDRRYRIVAPSGGAPRSEGKSAKDAVVPQFVEVASAAGLSFTHRETPFDDYGRQPLLPSKHSQLGGGIAWGDADGDGDEDVFLAGAAGQAGELYRALGGGRFELDTPSRAVFETDRAHEDMAPLWLDADADGDLDLFVASGGVECEADDDVLTDRLYLNDGTGGLTRAGVAAFPGGASSSGTAVAGDLDADGDLDLFVGGRVVPGRYPETPSSRLLRNDGGTFTDVTASWAPQLARVGLVTGALWSDADHDGRVDLLVTLEWGPVKLFTNTGSGLEDRTAAAGLAGRSGWWNSLSGADLDRDGDIDYVVMNVGLNTKYGAPEVKKPAILYYGDMDGSGRKNLVEAKLQGSDPVPVRGRSCSSSAMPFLKEKFPTYRAFAAALLPEIYTETCLDGALRLEANHFESGALLNDGKGRFEWRPLPRLAQASPGFGVVATDLDGDGFTDVHAVQNFFTREPETGLWRGGISVSLEADERGGLVLRPSAETGLVIAGDARGLAVCDLDDDGWPDLAVTQNDDRVLTFRNTGTRGAKPVAVALRGPRGNPTGVGSRVVATHADGSTQTAEVYAGSGYLSQSTAKLYFGKGASPLARVHVTWPDGSETVEELTAPRERVTIEHPAR